MYLQRTRGMGSGSVPSVLVGLLLSLTVSAVTQGAELRPLLVSSHNGATDKSCATRLGTIGKYNTAGTTLNASLVSGLCFPDQIAVSGANFFVADEWAGTVGEYTISGATVNAALITGLNHPRGIAVSGSTLYVSSETDPNPGDGVIGTYTTSGATLNPTLITGLTDPHHLQVYGLNLFVASGNNTPAAGRVGEYTTAGAPVNASLITGLIYPHDIAMHGGVLFVTDETAGTIGEYTTSGSPVNPALLSGLLSPVGLSGWCTELFVATPAGGTIGLYTTGGGILNSALVSGLTQPNDVVALVPDTDGDGVPDLCDNCAFTPNGPSLGTCLGDTVQGQALCQVNSDCTSGMCSMNQEDTGGVGAGSTPDGIGDACQCGDVNNDGIVDNNDATFIKRAVAGIAPYPGGVTTLPGYNKCQVVNGAPGQTCNNTQATIIQRAVAGLAPGIVQGCHAATIFP